MPNCQYINHDLQNIQFTCLNRVLFFFLFFCLSNFSIIMIISHCNTPKGDPLFWAFTNECCLFLITQKRDQVLMNWMVHSLWKTLLCQMMYLLWYAWSVQCGAKQLVWRVWWWNSSWYYLLHCTASALTSSWKMVCLLHLGVSMFLSVDF